MKAEWLHTVFLVFAVVVLPGPNLYPEEGWVNILRQILWSQKQRTPVQVQDL